MPSNFFNLAKIKISFFIAILSSLFLYINYIFHIDFIFLNTIFGLLTIYLILKYNSPIHWFYIGFFIGILWFWWVSVAFFYYDKIYLIPFIIIFMGFSYGIIFYLLALISEKIEKYIKIPSIFLSAIFLLTISYIHPFGFDWFRIELIFTDSYFSVEKPYFMIILFSIALTIYKKNILYLLLIFFAISNKNSNIHFNNFNKKINLVETKIMIEDKWKMRNRRKYLIFILQTIQDSIKLNKKIVIFPESILPFSLNRHKRVMNAMVDLSDKITIILGALYFSDKGIKNSTYIFSKKTYRIIDKVIYTPFGEKPIFPEWVNKLFNFKLQIVYQEEKNKKFMNFKIDNTTYRNGICFEGTSEFIYQNSPKDMIIISNNGWFYPSIQSILQKKILKFYSKKYKITIYHSSNMSKSFTIIPNN